MAVKLSITITNGTSEKLDLKRFTTSGQFTTQPPHEIAGSGEANADVRGGGQLITEISYAVGDEMPKGFSVTTTEAGIGEFNGNNAEKTAEGGSDGNFTLSVKLN